MLDRSSDPVGDRPVVRGRTIADLLQEIGLHAAWFALEDLGGLIRRHRADDTVGKAIARILSAKLIVVDDIGLLAVAPDAAEGLYRLVDAAYEKRSVAISLRCPMSTGQGTLVVRFRGHHWSEIRGP